MSRNAENGNTPFLNVDNKKLEAFYGRK
jgi:hypothetical protein